MPFLCAVVVPLVLDVNLRFFKYLSYLIPRMTQPLSRAMPPNLYFLNSIFIPLIKPELEFIMTQNSKPYNTS